MECSLHGMCTFTVLVKLNLLDVESGLICLQHATLITTTISVSAMESEPTILAHPNTFLLVSINMLKIRSSNHGLVKCFSDGEISIYDICRPQNTS
jgi:hypothetical protein